MMPNALLIGVNDAMGPFMVAQINSALIGLLPPPLQVAISIAAAIFLAVESIRFFPVLVSSWAAVPGCAWTSSFLSFLGCLWTTFWTLVQTIVWVCVIVVALLLVIINIVALVAAL